jgi:replication factor A1
MEIKDIQANQGNIDIVATVIQKEDERTFEKFGKQGRVCNAILQDETGQVKLTLWNEDVDKVKQGDKIHVQNGWCSEFKGEKQLSSGKFGKIEVVEAVGLMTNDPGILQQEQQIQSENIGAEVQAEPEVSGEESEVEGNMLVGDEESIDEEFIE